MPRLYWVRHGENLANLTKEFSSRRVDYSLTPKGVMQAQQTAQHFSDTLIHAIYASPLKRTMETAEMIAAPHRLRVAARENFREVDVGELEGRPANAADWALHDEIVSDWLQGHITRSFPGGENYRQLWERMRTGLEQIVEEGEDRNVIVVSHGGILYLTVQNFFVGVDRTQLHDIHNGSITEVWLERRDGQLYGELVAWADHSHLYGAAADLVSGMPDADSFVEKRSRGDKTSKG